MSSNNDELIDATLKLPYHFSIRPESDGTFFGQVLEFPGCFATGETAQEALTSLQATAEGWLEATISLGQSIPPPADLMWPPKAFKVAPSPPAPARVREEAERIVAEWGVGFDPENDRALTDAIASALTSARQAGEDEAREVLASWMMAHGYATGHGDTTEMLLAELLIEIDDCVKRARQAAREEAATTLDDEACSYDSTADECVVIKGWSETGEAVTTFRTAAKVLRTAATSIRQRMEGGK